MLCAHATGLTAGSSSAIYTLSVLHAGFATYTKPLMNASEYTFKLVQVCLPEPSKLVVMCDKRKRQFVCLRQVYNSCLDGLLPSYQAFY